MLEKNKNQGTSLGVISDGNKGTINNKVNNNGLIANGSLENNGIINNGTITYNYGNTSNKTTSILSKVIKKLGETAYEIDLHKPNKIDLTPFDIEKKIEYNLVIKNRPKFDKYKMYYIICDSVLNVMDNSLYQSKNKLMNMINDCYEDILGSILLKAHKAKEKKDKIELIQEQADEIIDLIKNKLICMLETNEIYYEDKELGVNIILCYAFMQCKILEKPLMEGEK